MRFLLMIGIVFSLTACATGGTGQVAKASSLAFLNSYDMALQDYQAGKIMEARARVLAMDAKRENYKRAQTLLKNNIDPARIRLLRHYKAKAKKAAKKRQWSKAIDFYQQTAEFSAKPEIFLTYAKSIHLKMRQTRISALLKQRRIEDKAWQIWARSYKPPRGISNSDVVFSRMQNFIKDDLEERSNRAYREARRYLNKSMPDVAYIEIESYLRWHPESEKGQRLLTDIREAMPKGLVLKSTKLKATAQKTHSKTKKQIRKSDISRLMKAGEWLKAKDAALSYQRYAGNNADKLLKSIRIGLTKAAASLFTQGSVAFRKEHIDEAVKLWEQSVIMQPDNSEYLDALLRATQLQERLHLLRHNKP
ncbi:MAG: hypothetical protein Q9M20_03885 [Mariprofundaceae bacterium]|nr:hypothetical protein [Mariprofundaceae bacterium]